MPAKSLEPEVYFSKCREVHGENRYDYSNTVYVSTKKKIKIHCNECGNDFEMYARDHLYNKQGCPKCHLNNISKLHSKTTEQFIEEARSVHGDAYDYSDTTYINKETKVKFKCKNCGEIIEMLPRTHLKTSVCCPNKCVITPTERLKTPKDRGLVCVDTQTFIEKSKMIHGDDKYDYSQVVYINSEKEVILKCKDCGTVFKITPHQHLTNGKYQGCPECAKRQKMLGLEEFIKRSKEIYGEDEYDYSKVEYVNVYTKVRLCCKRCGTWFTVTPSNHLSGISAHSCPNCHTSRGERRLFEIIQKEFNFRMIEHYEVMNNTNVSKNKRFYIDAYLPDFNLFIEFNGMQHYKPTKLWGGQERFEKQVLRDEAIRLYCKENNIRLLEIPYNKINDLKSILIRELDSIASEMNISLDSFKCPELYN